MVVTTESIVKEYEQMYDEMKLQGIHLCIASVDDFRQFSLWDNSIADYDFTHTKILVDKTGEITQIVKEKGTIPSDKKNEFIDHVLDAYINHVFRSVKCLQRQNVLGAHFEAIGSIPYLLDAIFALHGRPKPYYGYLVQELKTYPLKKCPWEIDQFLEDILAILSKGDLPTQQKLLRDVEQLFRKEGYNQVFDAWEGQDRWAMSYAVE